MTLAPRVVVVRRRTELDELVARHGTRRAAAFFLSTRGRGLAEVEARHEAAAQALAQVSAAIPPDWRRGEVERADLDRFLFAPDDLVVVVGQDGLVANVAKYLDGQPVLGVDPEPGRNPGVLLPFRADGLAPALIAAAAGDAPLEERVMVRAVADDGQEIVALNELFVGHASHQSARYRVKVTAGEERQSSSGVVVGTGTGATGWCRSIWRQSRSGLTLPTPTERRLTWFVREAWPSPATGTTLVEGELHAGERLAVTAETDGLVVFGDGIESDHVTLAWGQRVDVAVAERALSLVQPAYAASARARRSAHQAAARIPSHTGVRST